MEIIVQSEGHSKEIKSKTKTILEDLNKRDRICLLRKSLYGLRQAGRNWYNKLDRILRKYEAVPSKSDPCIYHIGKRKNSLLIGIYVDDIIMASRDPDKITKLKSDLAGESRSEISENRSTVSALNSSNKVTRLVCIRESLSLIFLSDSV